jgi:hypothetical protein
VYPVLFVVLRSLFWRLRAGRTELLPRQEPAHRPPEPDADGSPVPVEPAASGDAAVL